MSKPAEQPVTRYVSPSACGECAEVAGQPSTSALPDSKEPCTRTLLLGREPEQDLFRGVLARSDQKGDPDEGHVVLVHGPGGIGKSKLLQRYREIAAEGIKTGRRHRQRMLVAAVDWEHLRPADYAAVGGPPIWLVLDRIYDAVKEAVKTSRRDALAVSRAFVPFRRKMTTVPELAEEVRRAVQGTESGRHTSTADIDAVLKAVSSGAALVQAPPEVAALAEGITHGAAGAEHIALDLREALKGHRNGPVSEEVYSLVLRRVETLVNTFGQCLRRVSTKVRPVVVTLDTCELIFDAQEHLRRAIRESGPRTVWVIGMRSDPDAFNAARGQAARYQTVAPSRLTLVPLTRFSEATVSDYLSRVLRDGLPAGVTADRVAELTRGIPLAIWLVCKLINDGQEPEIVLRPVSEPGVPSVVISELAERYLTHARNCPLLQADLKLLYGLALLHSDRLDPDLLAALWDVDPIEVADLTTGLAERHDFVLYDSRRLHQDIRDTIRQYLLGDIMRAAQRPTNQRAIEHVRRRLADLDLPTVDDQITSEEWQNLAAALVWHTSWIDPHSGFKLLCDLLPAACVLAPRFAGVLLDTMEFFSHILSRKDRRALAALRAPQASAFSQSQDSRVINVPNAQRALTILEGGGDDVSVMATDISRSVFLGLLRAQLSRRLGDEPTHTLAVLENASRAFRTDGRRPISRVLASLAERLARKLIFHVDDSPSSFAAGIRAAELVIKHDPKRASGYMYRGSALLRMGRYPDAVGTFKEAVRLNEILAMEHTRTGEAARKMHLNENAARALAEAARLHKKLSQAEVCRGIAFARMSQYQDAMMAFHEAIRLNPADATPLVSLAECLLMQDRRDDAETSLQQAIELRPEDVLEPQVLLAALIRRRDPAQAARLAEIALEHPGRGLTTFRRGEMRALAYLLAGEPDLAEAEFRAAAARHVPGDIFTQPLYDLLDDPLVPGITELLAGWLHIEQDAAE